jgi:hypothetical protein
MKRHFALLLICGLLIGSCKKTETQTQAEINGAALSKAITNTSITLVYVWNAQTSQLLINGSGISVLGNGLANVIDGNNVASINLGTLKYWELTPAATNGDVLNLYY